MAAEQSLGEYCDRVGLSAQNLIDQLPAINVDDFTNGVVCEIFTHYKIMKGSVDWPALRDSVYSIFGLRSESMPRSQLHTLFTTVRKRRRVLSINRRPINALHAFLDESFKRPKDAAPTKRKCTESVDACLSHPKTETEEVTRLTAENHKLQKQNKIHQRHIRRLQHRLAGKAGQRKTLLQQIRRNQASCASWKNKFCRLQVLYKTADKTIDILQQQLSQCKDECERWGSRNRKAHQRKQNVTQGGVLDVTPVKCRRVNRDVTADVAALEDEVQVLKDRLDDRAVPALKTKSDGKSYSPWVREASYQLQNLGVSQKNTSEAIKSVCAASETTVSGPLPCSSTQNTLTKEMKALSRQQVFQAASRATNLTLKYDGTTKSLGHMVEVEIATKEGPLLMGITQQVGGTASEYVRSITKTISRVEQTSVGSAEQLSILNKVSNTMTDRCVTNTAVDDQLEALKGSKLNRFRCAMHPLDAIAKACEKVVKVHEDSVSINDKKTKGNYPFQHRGESNTQALVRTTAKLFHDNKYSCVHELTVHLKTFGAVPQEDEKKSVLYHRFVGNRFHIYFLSSGCLYHYRNALISFFTDVFVPQNSVHSCVLNALHIQDMHVTTRALGIVGKLITGPWMRLLGVETNILGMNKHFQEALGNITAWTRDASSLIQPNAPCAFSCVDVKRDTVFLSLMERTEFDGETISLLQTLCKACVEVMERQLKSQLPGGEFWSPSTQLLIEAETCSNTNISGERCFATADQEILRARNATIGHIEAKTMFRRNKTGQWLDRYSVDEKSTKITLAMKDVHSIRLQDKTDKETHHERVKDKLIQVRKQILQKEDRSRSKFEKWLEDMFEHGGLWANKNEMDRALKDLSNTKAIAATKAQIHIRTKILHCKLEGNIMLTKASLQELRTAVLMTINQAVPVEMQDLLEIILHPESVVGREFSQRWCEDDGRTQWYNGAFASCQATPAGNKDFRVEYEGEANSCYMAPEEFIVDILRGDLHFII